MALSYSEFNSTPATIVTDIQNAILASTDWAVLGSTYPNLLKATTTAGASAIIELSPSGLAADNYHLPIRAWKAHTGASGGGSYSKDHAIWWSHNDGARVSTEILHCVVSASKDCLYIQIQGPRAGEPNAQDYRGHWKMYFFMSSLNRYFATTDTTPTVVIGGYSNTSIDPYDMGGLGFTYLNYGSAYVSQGVSGGTPWAACQIATVQPLNYNTSGNISAGQSSFGWTPQSVAALDSNNFYMFPFVVIDRVSGLRGTLTDLYFAGLSTSLDAANTMDVPVSPGYNVTYSGSTFKLHTVCQGNYYSNRNSTNPTPLSVFSMHSSQWAASSVVGVRTA